MENPENYIDKPPFVPTVDLNKIGNLKVGVDFLTVDTKVFGPDFTKQETIEAFNRLLQTHNDFKTVFSAYQSNSEIKSWVIIKLRKLASNRNPLQALSIAFLSDKTLPRLNINRVNMKVFKYTKDDQFINIYLNSKDPNLKSSVHIVFDNWNKFVCIKSLYPDLLKIGVGGFGNNFMASIFKSIVDYVVSGGRTYLKIIIDEPLSDFWNQFNIPLDSELSLKRSFSKYNSADYGFSQDSEFLNWTDLELWLYLRGYISKKDIKFTPLQFNIPIKKEG